MFELFKDNIIAGGILNLKSSNILGIGNSVSRKFRSPINNHENYILIFYHTILYNKIYDDTFARY